LSVRQPHWIASESPPADELGSLITKLQPWLLGVSASAASPPAAVARYQAALAEAAADTEAQFVLAGSGAWTTVRNGKRAMSFKELQASLA
jgi:hypothetical protein